MHTVIETEAYNGDAKSIGLSSEEQHQITTLISQDPTGGVVIQGTGGARKLRIAKKGKGKSGGYRIVWYFAAADVPVFLLAIFDKGQKINLSKAERNDLRKYLAGLAEDYRENVRSTVTQIGRAS